MPKATEPWSLTSLREKLIKIGAKVVSHGRYVTFQLAKVAVSRQVTPRRYAAAGKSAAVIAAVIATMTVAAQCRHGTMKAGSGLAVALRRRR
jgi:hypothetical protein